MTTPRILPTLFGIAAMAALAVCSPSAKADYRQQAEEQTDYIQTHFYDATAKRYHSRFPDEPNGLPYAFMWDNGVQWRLLVDADRYEPAKYGMILEAYGEGLRQGYWDPQVTVPGFNAYCSGPGGDDKYYDDNAWMVLGFLEAYAQTHQPKYLQWARETQAFVLSGWDDKLGGGIYWKLKHESKNTCVSAPDTVAALRLSVLGKSPEQLDWGLKLYRWTNATLQDKDGLFWDNIRLDGHIEKAKWTYNTALMIEANVLLFQMRHDRKALAEAEREADASIAAWQNPDTGRFADDAKFNHLLCQSLIRLYEADHKTAYLNAVRRHAAYGYRVVRDPVQGGYWSSWDVREHQPDEAKALIENASDGRLLWLLAPYPDSAALDRAGIGGGKTRPSMAQAEQLLRQAADSDTEAVEARFQLWKVLKREKKTADANAEEKTLAKMAGNEALRKRLQAVGWAGITQTPP